MAAAGNRTYRMQARAAASEDATERILDAAEQLFWENPVQPVTLAAVAELAGVSVHSIIRRFGGQQGMIAAAAARRARHVTADRGSGTPGDLPSVVSALTDHYEALGDRVLGLLAAEHAVPAVKEFADLGRQMHADWCAEMFADALAARRGSDRTRLYAQLIAVCDVYTWMLLRRQRGLSRRETGRALIEMLEPLINGRSLQ
jgi:AcrR family transcriptional regulator